MKRLLPHSLAAALAAAALLSAPALRAQGVAPELVLRVGKAYIGDGRVVQDARIAIADGKILSVTKDEGALPSGAKVKDLRRMSVMPGLVAAHTELTAVDLEANIAPDNVAADQFDIYREYDRLVRSGLTTVYLSPGRNRLVGGQGSVVKLAGKDALERVLRAQASLRVAIANNARSSVPAIFEPVESPTDDEPLKPSRQQRGSTRASQIAELDRAFAEARDATKQRGGVGSERVRYNLDAFRKAQGGTLPIRIASSSAADAWSALDWAQTQGAKAILERPVDAIPLKNELGQLEVPVVLAMPLRPHQANPGDYKRDADQRRIARPEAAGELSKAGVKIAIVPPSDADLDKLRMLAGLAGRFGLPTRSTLSSITLDAAKILGVDDRVGSIAAGKDADLVIMTGAPFDARTQIESVLVDGDEVYARGESAPVFAIRASRVLTGDGHEFRDGVVVVRGNKIVDIGDIPVPGGVEVIDAGDAVIAPGFVAAASRLGLHADSGSRFAAPTATDVASALDAADPAFEDALKAGVTTLFVTPDDAGLVGPRVAAVKTAGQRDAFVVRSVAGIRMALSASGAAGKKQLAAVLKKARDYVNPPKKDDKKKPAPKKAPAAAAKKEAPSSAAKPFVDVISGKWSGSVRGGPLPGPMPFEFDAKLTDKTKVSGTLKVQGPMPIPPVPFAGTFENNKLEMTGTVPQIGRLVCKGTYKDGTISGTISSQQGALNFSMKRGGGAVSEDAAKPKKKKKKKVKKDESLEPFRNVFAGKAALVVRVANSGAAKTAIETIAVESKLKLVLAGNARSIVQDAARVPDGVEVGFLLGANEVSWEEKGKLNNVAEQLSALGYRVILVSRAQSGTRYLPVHAAWAVATGFSARRALDAISAAPAACFGLDKRVGRLAVGADADIVLLSGDPFDLTTRVQAVWVDGKLRVDNLDLESEKKR